MNRSVCVCGGDGGRVVDSHVLFRRCRVSQLWALLHFIMPTLFDSHDEFNEWFSRDIESHAENKSAIDESEFDFSWLHLTISFICRRSPLPFCDDYYTSALRSWVLWTNDKEQGHPRRPFVCRCVDSGRHRCCVPLAPGGVASEASWLMGHVCVVRCAPQTSSPGST